MECQTAILLRAGKYCPVLRIDFCNFALLYRCFFVCQEKLRNFFAGIAELLQNELLFSRMNRCRNDATVQLVELLRNDAKIRPFIWK